jgi:hypothetical protein
MTAADLAAWTEALFTGEIIAPEAVASLLDTTVDLGDGATEIPGWAVVDAPLFGVPVHVASGGGGDTGHNAVTVWLPSTRQAIAVAAGAVAGILPRPTLLALATIPMAIKVSRALRRDYDDPYALMFSGQYRTPAIHVRVRAAFTPSTSTRASRSSWYRSNHARIG